MLDEYLQDLILSLPCPFCDAAAGWWCVTSGKRLSTQLHSQRCGIVLNAYGHGYAHGWHESADRARVVAAR